MPACYYLEKRIFQLKMDKTEHYFNDLTVLIESAFPKTCNMRGKIYQTAEQFLHDTQNMPNKRSSLKEAIEEDGTTILEVFRNCSCGSTLMDEFNCRRDMSDKGSKHRNEFNRLLAISQNQNIPLDIARSEIIKWLKGNKTETLEFSLKDKYDQNSYD